MTVETRVNWEATSSSRRSSAYPSISTGRSARRSKVAIGRGSLLASGHGGPRPGQAHAGGARRPARRGGGRGAAGEPRRRPPAGGQPARAGGGRGAGGGLHV